MSKSGRMIKSVLKSIGVLVLSLIGLAVLYFVFSLGLSRITVEAEKPLVSDVAIYILTNGVHTDIVVPTNTEYYNWSSELHHIQNLSNPNQYKYVALGWGDKGFYLNTPTWAELKLSTAFKAGFGLSSTAIHATFYRTMDEDESCKKVKISKSQYLRLIAYIKSNLTLGETNKTIKIETDANYGYTDGFYEANGTYSLFYTCNTWANEALKSCGQKSCLWTPFSKDIFAKYQ